MGKIVTYQGRDSRWGRKLAIAVDFASLFQDNARSRVRAPIKRLEPVVSRCWNTHRELMISTKLFRASSRHLAAGRDTVFKLPDDDSAVSDGLALRGTQVSAECIRYSRQATRCCSLNTSVATSGARKLVAVWQYRWYAAHTVLDNIQLWSFASIARLQHEQQPSWIGAIVSRQVS